MGRLKRYTILFSGLSILMVIFISLNSFSQSPAIDFERMAGTRIVHQMTGKEDSLSSNELIELRDGNGIPVWFSRDIFKNVCLTGECSMVRLRLYWNGAGNYLGFQVPIDFPLTNEFVATYCGGEANVAVSLANFGMDAEFVSRLPQNDIAEASLKSLHKYGVKTGNVIYGGERLGVYYLETGAVARPSKVIYDRTHSSISEIKAGMINREEILKSGDWFHWTDITPALSQGAAEACLEAVEVANKLGVTVSVDLNYRKNIVFNENHSD